MEKRRNIDDMYPLAPMQQGLLFHTLLAPETGIYVPQIALFVEGELDAAALQQAWQQTISRHSVLRTTFYWEQHEQPFQVVWRQVAVPWQEQDWRGDSPEVQQARLQAVLESERHAGFDLNTPPLMRLILIRRGAAQYQLLWSYHHLILDGWSAGIVLQEVFSAYLARQHTAGTDAAPPVAMPPARPYGDYIAWLRQQDEAAAKTFWQAYLQGFTQATDIAGLAPGHPRPSAATWDQQQHVFSADDTARLRAFAQQHQLTLNTCLQGAFGLLLSRYSASTDVLFGATTAGRPPALPGVASMVGLFINTLPVRVQVDNTTAVVPWLQQLQETRAAASAYEHTALMSIQAWSDLPAAAPLFKSLLVLENYPLDASMLSGPSSLKLQEVSFAEWTHFPLTLQVAVGSALILTAKYNCTQFEAAAITRLLGHLHTLLLGMVAQPWRRLGAVSLRSAAEQQQLMQWNQTTQPYPLERPLPEWFEAQVDRTPTAVAVSADDQSLYYQELNRQANQLAHYLQALGVGPEVLVAICMQRSCDMVTALLATLKAGGTYVPLDPDYPSERLAWMLADSGATVLMTDNSAVNSLPALPEGVCLLNLDRHRDAFSQQPGSNPPRDLAPDHGVYMIYTSGSTGHPKGALNTQRGLVNRLCWMQATYGLQVGDRVLHKTPLSFDVSAWEVFWPLLNGASLVLCRPGAHGDSGYLVDTIIRHQIDTLHFVPAMLEAFLDEPAVAHCHSLKRVICSGEALAPGLQKRFFDTFATAELHNLYGPTEAAIDVAAWACDRQQAAEAGTVPIGHPIANTQLYVLDPQGVQVPVGIAGELHIAGVGLARGYHQRPALTAAAFIPNPYGNVHAPCLYKTGDLARYRPDGAIEFLGRLDQQIKLRGLRIELGEIETRLAQHASVRQVVVSRQEDQAGNPHLVAYVVPSEAHQSADLDAADLGHYLRQRLPDYMVPTAFIGLNALPLLPNGKINRRALPAFACPDLKTTTGVPPRTPTETRLAALWRDILHLDGVGIHDNFFTLGGNSLIATRMTARLRAAFAVDLPLRTLFERPTIAALAAHIEALHMALQKSDVYPAAPAGRKEMTL